MKIDNNFLKISGSDIMYPYDINEHIANNPSTYAKLYSFEDDETTETLISSSIFCVVESDTIVSHSLHQDVIEVTPVQSGSVYVKTYSIQNLSTQEIDEAIEYRWNYVRKKRDKLLSETDYLALQDTTPLTEEWTIYRQSLRDVTNQSDPFNVSWPTKP
jgi:hypothetical protein|tara:strand:- start:282 stop:758 length:477 start_codon:yes stop_codon:yes gene_type:complete